MQLEHYYFKFGVKKERKINPEYYDLRNIRKFYLLTLNRFLWRKRTFFNFRKSPSPFDKILIFVLAFLIFSKSPVAWKQKQIVGAPKFWK
jgi:hypothetical protein